MKKTTARKPTPKKAKPVRVVFPGQIKAIRSALDTCGDKVGTLTVTFNPKGSIVADLDKLQKPDAEVFVVIVEKGHE
jgi:hypothetical protein